MRYASFTAGGKSGVAWFRDGVWRDSGRADLLAMLEDETLDLADPGFAVRPRR